MRQSQQEISPENAENELGEAKISKLLLKFSLPCILSLLISALYNIVDQIFIGNSELGYLDRRRLSHHDYRAGLRLVLRGRLRGVPQPLSGQKGHEKRA